MIQLSNTFFKRESTSIKFQKESEVCYCILSGIPITVEFFTIIETVVATTRRNSTHSMLTSAKLSIGYLVVRLQENSTRSPHCIALLFI